MVQILVSITEKNVDGETQMDIKLTTGERDDSTEHEKDVADVLVEVIKYEMSNLLM